jgi:osmoprotectant transport system substrate-binding protein
MVLFALAACSGGGGGKSAASAPPGGAQCMPQPDNQLVVLTDDRKSQNSDNVVPVARSTVAKAPLTDALNAVSQALSQNELQGLNRAVTLDGANMTTTAREFVRRLRIGDGLSGGSGDVVVAASGFSESQVLADVYATVLTAAGYRARVRGFPNREALEPALEAGQVQVTPEYAATLTTFLASKANSGAQPSNQIERTVTVLQPLAKQRGLTVLEPAAATNQNAFAVTKATANSLGITTLSQLAARCPSGVTFGGPPECPARPFCLGALQRTYRLPVRFSPLDADGPRTRQALQQGDVLLAEVFSSDADVVSAVG